MTAGQSLTPSTCLPYFVFGSMSHKLHRILQQATNFNKLQGLLHSQTRSSVSVAKFTSGKQDGISQRDWKNTEHMAAAEVLRSQPL